MKISKTSLRWIVVTSIYWIIVFSLIGGFYQKGYSFTHFIYLLSTSKPQPIYKVLGPLNPSFSAALISMYKQQPQMGIDGSTYKLKGKVKILPQEGMYIYNLCRKLKPQHTLEVGLAYGFSTLYFLAALKANGKGIHVALDPFEKVDWHGIGLKKVSELGMTKSLRFIPQKSEFALPALAQEGLQYEVIFIDGSHRFENVLLDFTLCDYLCAKGGFIIFHDAVNWPAVRKAVKFVESNRADFQRQDIGFLPGLAVFKKMADDSRKSGHFVNF